MKLYRLVSDYGWGDKSWFERFLTEEEAIEKFSRNIGIEFKTIEQCLNYDHYTYSVEEDHEDDVEDWDWMDS